jgi:transcription elongation factor B subunit 1
MLEGEYKESTTGVITFREISGAVLERVVQYFHFKHRYSNTVEDIPSFHIEPEFALDLLMASHFLDT